MAMTTGSGSRGFSSDINVTPLIDVLLVLLIIFMVIVPVTPKGLQAVIPQPSKHLAPQPNPNTVVVSVSHLGGNQLAYRINQDSVAKGDLLARLTAIYQNRADRVLFIKGDGDLDFAQVADVVDMGHLAGADHIGLITAKVSQGL